MQIALRSQVHLMGLFSRLECSKGDASSINAYTSMEFSSMRFNAKKSSLTRTAASFLVLKIDALWHITQVAKSVVQWVPINMVNKIPRPLTKDIEPGKPTLMVNLAENANFFASVSGVSSHITNSNTHCVFRLPRKHASLRIVVQDFAQAFYGKILLSHDAPPVRWDQRPVSVAIAAWASPFYMAVA
jgi:hypothetical protein